jgi:hypothetical protein
MSPFTPKSIKDISLEKYLDGNYREQGGYAEFVALIKARATKVSIARRFGVSRPTMDKWVTIYKEQDNG